MLRGVALATLVLMVAPAAHAAAPTVTFQPEHAPATSTHQEDLFESSGDATLLTSADAGGTGGTLTFSLAPGTHATAAVSSSFGWTCTGLSCAPSEASSTSGTVEIKLTFAGFTKGQADEVLTAVVARGGEQAQATATYAARAAAPHPRVTDLEGPYPLRCYRGKCKLGGSSDTLYRRTFGRSRFNVQIEDFAAPITLTLRLQRCLNHSCSKRGKTKTGAKTIAPGTRDIVFKDFFGATYKPAKGRYRMGASVAGQAKPFFSEPFDVAP